MIKLVVFDWNGTLLSDSTACVEAVNKQLEILDLPPISLKQYQEHYDVPHWQFYHAFGVKPEIIKQKSILIAEAFHSHYEPRAAHARTRKGTRSVLTTLASNNMSSIILSNHTSEGIYLQLERLKLTHFFGHILANEAIGMGHFKGKQDRLEQHLKLYKIPPSRVAIVGDTVEEIGIGKNLRLKTIAITGGYNSTTRLKAAKPDFLIHKLTDLISVINQL